MSAGYAYVFDAYGTLFDVHSAAARHKDRIGASWERLSQVWRAKHLEYTWIHAGIGRMATFRVLAERSLDTAIATVGGVPPGVREDLLAAYLTLAAYPEVKDVLSRLRSKGARTAILSNGDPDMLAAAVSSAGLTGLLDAVISIQDAGIFKPHGKVYELPCKRLGLEPAQISFQSSNRWDAAAGTAFGYRAVWVNRTGAPPEYPDLPPALTVRDLRPLLED